MLTVIVTVVMGFLILAGFVLVVINRESERIVTAAIPLAFAACSALALIFAFARQEPVSRVFPVRFSFQLQDKLPMSIPYRPTFLALSFVDQIRQRDSSVLNAKADPQGVLVYHELLQKMLVDWIAMRHSGHWRMELLTYEGPAASTQSQWSAFPDAKSEPAKVLSVEELRSIFSRNRFAGVHSGFGSLALPTGTTLSVETPSEDGASGQIRFRNRYCVITIQTSPSINTVHLGLVRRLGRRWRLKTWTR